MISLQHTRFNTRLYNAKYSTHITYSYIVHGNISVYLHTHYAVSFIIKYLYRYNFNDKLIICHQNDHNTRPTPNGLQRSVQYTMFEQ